MSARSPEKGLGRPPLRYALLLGFLLLAALGWSWLWYEGSARAEALLDAAIAREQAEGRRYACDDRHTGGYPFRLEIICVGPQVELADGTAALTAAAERLTVVAQVWNPEHVIVEIAGPLLLSSGGSGSALAIEADWRLLQASLRLPGGRAERVDVAADGLRVTIDGPDDFVIGDTNLRADRFELHGRALSGREEAPEFGLRAAGLIVEPPDMPAFAPTDLVAAARFHGLPETMPRNLRAFLAAWQAEQGLLEIAGLTASQQGTRLSAEGNLELDASGRPAGFLSLTLAGADLDGTDTAGGGAFGGLAPILAMGLRLVGESVVVDGAPAVQGRIELRDGVARFGPVPVLELPSLL